MRHVVLYEPDSSGHRLIYVRYIAEAIARSRVIRVTLVTSPAVARTDWIISLQEQLRPHFSVHIAAEQPIPRWFRHLPSKLARQMRHTQLLCAEVNLLRRREGVDQVFIPFLDDYCLFPLAWREQPFSGLPWSGIAVRPRFHLPRMGADVPRRKEDWVERWAYRRLLRDPALSALFSIDPYFVAFINDERVRAVCDPAEMAAPRGDEEWLSAPAEAVVLLVYGYIDQRKGIDRLLAALHDPAVPQTICLALVGEQHPAVRLLMNEPNARELRHQRRLVEVPRRITDAEEKAAFARADIIWSFYPGSYCSSGAMVRAGQMGRPVLTTAEGLAGLITREAGSGLAVPEDDQRALSAALTQLAQDADLRGRCGEAGRRRFSASTGVAFGDAIVRDLLATPPMANAELP